VTPDVDVDEQPAGSGGNVFSERVEPTLSTAAKGHQYVSQIMETVIRKLVPDGEDQITYRCLVCGLEFPTKRGVGGHYGFHVARGEAEAKPDASKNIIKVVPPEEPVVQAVQELHDHSVELLSEPEPEPERRITLDTVAVMLQGIVDIAVKDAVAGVQRQLDAALAEIERLRQERIALRDLLQ
jgi:hypothetical protein